MHLKLCKMLCLDYFFTNVFFLLWIFISSHPDVFTDVGGATFQQDRCGDHGIRQFVRWCRCDLVLMPPSAEETRLQEVNTIS